ncbi:hypothetical protein LSAT2_029425 [Lamellibrachia satsuma]|nr:hypothetical protein LSAT2_029425 [Lamellibrachia satsuma]
MLACPQQFARHCHCKISLLSTAVFSDSCTVPLSVAVNDSGQLPVRLQRTDNNKIKANLDGRRVASDAKLPWLPVERVAWTRRPRWWGLASRVGDSAASD